MQFTLLRVPVLVPLPSSFVFLLSLLPAPLAAQDASFIAITKSQGYQQIAPKIVTLRDDDSDDADQAPLIFEAFADASAPGLLTAGTLTLPGGATRSLEFDGPDELQHLVGFEFFGEMEGAFPPGAYTLDLTTVNDGPQSVTLDLPAVGYPALTQFTEFEAAQAIDPSAPFTLRWDAIADGTEDDVAIVEIYSSTGPRPFESPNVGEPGQLTGLSTEVTLPPGTLEPGHEYTVNLLVFRPVSTSDAYPGVFTMSALGTTVRMPLRTTGGTDTTSPALLDPAPPYGHQDVPLNSVVTLRFDEPMDTTVDAAQAIAWSGLPNPGLVSYSWSPDGRRLSCHYTPGLPVSTLVGWTLNPPGSAAKLADAAGNPLADGASGSFTTSAMSNLGAPDVSAVLLGKGRFYFQEGPTPTDLGSHVAALFADLNGVGTVTSVDLAIPGRGVASNVAEPTFDYRELEAEARFAQQSDLDRFFPNGDYPVTLHTIHDGDRSITLTTGPDAYPNAPTIRNLVEAQAIDASKPFVLQWDPMAGGTAADFIEVFVEGEGETFFAGPGIGEPGALDGTLASVAIPAGVLPPGRTLNADILFGKTADSESGQYPGVTARALFASITHFQIRTIGAPFQPQLDIDSDGTTTTVTVTAEIGRVYELRVSNDLRAWVPVWTQYLGGDGSSFLGTFQYFETLFGRPQRFYQAAEIPFPD